MTDCDGLICELLLIDCTASRFILVFCCSLFLRIHHFFVSCHQHPTKLPAMQASRMKTTQLHPAGYSEKEIYYFFWGFNYSLVFPTWCIRMIMLDQCIWKVGHISFSSTKVSVKVCVILTLWESLFHHCKSILDCDAAVHLSEVTKMALQLRLGRVRTLLSSLNSMTFYDFFHDLFKFTKTLGLAASFKYSKPLLVVLEHF